MVKIQRQIKPRTPTGGRKKENRSKRLFEKANFPTLTTIGERDTTTLRIRGGNTKIMTNSINTINVYNPKTKKHTKAKIEMSVECKSNRHYVRRNILVKGVVVKTDLGNVKITSRPSQNGSVEGVLVA